MIQLENGKNYMLISIIYLNNLLKVFKNIWKKKQEKKMGQAREFIVKISTLNLMCHPCIKEHTIFVFASQYLQDFHSQRKPITFKSSYLAYNCNHFHNHGICITFFHFLYCFLFYGSLASKDRKSTLLNSSHPSISRMPSSA